MDSNNNNMHHPNGVVGRKKSSTRNYYKPSRSSYLSSSSSSSRLVLGICGTMAFLAVYFVATKEIMMMVLQQKNDDYYDGEEGPTSSGGSSKVGGGFPGGSLSLEENHRVNPPARSLHPKWKLWEEMAGTNEQQQALDRVGGYLRKYGELIMKNGDRGKIAHGTCPMVPFGVGEGHALCGPPLKPPCTFVSFGINDDPSFDNQLASDWQCRGFAADPTVDHPSKLHPLVTFHNLGASMLRDNEERQIDKGGTEEWWMITLPSLRKALRMDRMDIVKLDCEGCEVAFAHDIIREDPLFLQSVDQISIETHVSRTWINSTKDVYYFGMHFALLEEAGFRLEWSSVFGCSKRHEITGCVPELEGQYGFPCGYKDWPKHPNVVIGRSCQDFLWKRYDHSQIQGTTTAS